MTSTSSWRASTWSSAIRGRIPQANKPGGIQSKEMPLHVAKVAIWNPATKKADRVGFKLLADGKKVRRFSSNGEMLDA